ncbi:SDR family NAD(P)-dependent oxidoreductase [Nocardia sp. NPDC059240]|uniref:SDR family NAD(P)-dependent oxidoreductase n=1 Tax=Nocardia sp. NPDC059240 TaxID=3346786 RepID=UPI0036C2E25B
MSKRPFYPELAVVTGAGSGIGRGTSKAFAGIGAKVVVVDINRAHADETVAIIEAAGGEAVAYTVDVSDTAALEDLGARVKVEHGVPDAVLNNAGILVGGPFLETPDADFQRIIDINMMAMIHGCRIFGAQMVERGRGGQLANVASLAAFGPARFTSGYSVGKYAIKHFGDCLRAEFAHHDIGVTTICPGLIATNLADTAAVSSIDEAQAGVGKVAARRLMTRLGMHPDKAGQIVVDAMRRNLPIRPIRPEAYAFQAVGRVAPGLWRGLARVAMGPELEALGRGFLARPDSTAQVAALVGRMGSKDVGNPAESPDFARLLDSSSTRHAGTES